MRIGKQAKWGGSSLKVANSDFFSCLDFSNILHEDFDLFLKIMPIVFFFFYNPAKGNGTKMRTHGHKRRQPTQVVKEPAYEERNPT